MRLRKLSNLALLACFLTACQQKADENPTNQTAWLTSFTRSNMAAASVNQITQAATWQSIYTETNADTKENLASLNPSDAQYSPVIWNVNSNTFTAVIVPHFIPIRPANKKYAYVKEVLAFSNGLAPASIVFSDKPLSAADIAESYELTNLSKYNSREIVDFDAISMSVRWGFVNKAGEWVISPIYQAVRPFVGKVAAVELPRKNSEENRYQLYRLIDRKGAKFDWQAKNSVGWEGIEHIAIEQLGNKTIVSQQNWRDEQQEWHSGLTHIVENNKISLIPGRVLTLSVNGNSNKYVKSDPSGDLWYIDIGDNSQQLPTLWSSSRGVISINSMVSSILSADTVVTNANTVQKLDGTVIADGFKVMPLSTKRFIACAPEITEDPTLPKTSASPTQSVQPKANMSNLCGVMNNDGSWWVRPSYQTIEKTSEGIATLKTQTLTCFVDYTANTFGRCLSQSLTSQKNNGIPFIKPESILTKRLDKFLTPYYDKVAVGVYNSQPGIIDKDGKWLTPKLTGSVFEQLSQLNPLTYLFTYEQNYRRETIPDAIGLKSNSWQIPPVFNSLNWRQDGTLIGCSMAGQPYSKCWHLSNDGQFLSDTNKSPALGKVEQAKEEMIENALPVTDQNVVEKDSPIAVSINNGKWGFQDSNGLWVIEPKFDDAFDFNNEKAAVAMLKTTPPIEDNPETKSLMWGLIDTQGNWLQKPNATDANSLFQEEINKTAKPKYPFLFKYEIAKAANDYPPPKQVSKPGIVIDAKLIPELKLGIVTFANLAKEIKLAVIDTQGNWLIPKINTTAIKKPTSP